jgi:hypothetical protein
LPVCAKPPRGLVFEREILLAEEIRMRRHGTISGVSGQLKGAHGTFQSVGQTLPSITTTTYFAEIQLRN